MKQIIRTGDLAPKGVASTYCEERLNFNSTFKHIKKQSDKLFGVKRLIKSKKS